MTGHNFINCHFCVVTIVFGHWGHNNTLVPTANKTFKTLSSTNDQKAWENTVLQASNTLKKILSVVLDLDNFIADNLRFHCQ